MKRLYLASQSPRRRELLLEAGIEFQILTVKVSEIPKKNLNLNEQIVDLARQKAVAAVSEAKHLKLQDILILSADTMVIHDGRALGKPKNLTEARLTLRQLSGDWHKVITGVCLIDTSTNVEKAEACITRVKFRELSDADIEEYLATGDHEDKAGSYGIQGHAGKFVEEIDGPFDNVVGLPVELVRRFLKGIRYLLNLPNF